MLLPASNLRSFSSGNVHSLFLSYFNYLLFVIRCVFAFICSFLSNGISILFTTKYRYTTPRLTSLLTKTRKVSRYATQTGERARVTFLLGFALRCASVWELVSAWCPAAIRWRHISLITSAITNGRKRMAGGRHSHTLCVLSASTRV